MSASAEAVVAGIREAFAVTPHPGDAFLVGSRDGCEPAETLEPFRGLAHWSDVPPETLDAEYTALSFLSDGGFRFFLPAYVVAELEGRLATADPLFHLASGFLRRSVRVAPGSGMPLRSSGGDTLLNPRRYGAITFEDYARFRLSVFCREEARALADYLQHRGRTASLEHERDTIEAALERFWLARADAAPTRAELDAHLADVETPLRGIAPR